MRADSAFWNYTLINRLQRAGWTYSIGVRNYKNIKAQTAQIPKDAWVTLADYPDTGEAQIAETTLSGRRMIVRRSTPRSQRGAMGAPRHARVPRL